MRINLTQHEATAAQECERRDAEMAQQVKQLLTFEELPDLDEVVDRARELAQIAADTGADEAMIGGAPYLILALDPALRMKGVEPVYAFSKRESVDEEQPDGSVIKRTRFKHLGFVRFDARCGSTGAPVGTYRHNAGSDTPKVSHVRKENSELLGGTK